MNNQLVKFAIIGFGRIGKRHAEMIYSNPNSELVAVVDINDNEIKAASSLYKNINVANTIEALKNQDLEIDVLNVCTPNYLHAEHCIEGLQNDWHAVCEKPMDIDSKKCKQVIELEKIKNKQVFCVLQNRFSPPSLWLKSIVEDDKLGKIHFIQVNCFWNRGESYFTESDWKGNLQKDGGPLYTQFSHFIDLLYWLFGDLEILNANFSQRKFNEIIEFEDTGTFQFKTKNKTLGSFNYSIAVFKENLESSIMIIGEKGTVKVGGQYMNKVEFCNIENYTLPNIQTVNPPNNYGQYKGSAANHSFVIEGVINAIQKNENKLPNSSEGKAVVQLIENVYKFRQA